MTTAEHESPTLLTVSETATRLRLSRGTVYRLVRSGILPAVKVGTGRFAPLRIDADELETFIYGNEDT